MNKNSCSIELHARQCISLDKEIKTKFTAMARRSALFNAVRTFPIAIHCSQQPRYQTCSYAVSRSLELAVLSALPFLSLSKRSRRAPRHGVCSRYGRSRLLHLWLVSVAWPRPGFHFPSPGRGIRFPDCPNPIVELRTETKGRDLNRDDVLKKKKKKWSTQLEMSLLTEVFAQTCRNA